MEIEAIIDPENITPNDIQTKASEMTINDEKHEEEEAKTEEKMCMEIGQTMNQKLSIYYDKFFPFELITRWLSYGHGDDPKNIKLDKDFFIKREFSLNLQNDAYLRYQSFKDATTFKQNIMKFVPQKIDIGAIYKHDPKFLRSTHPDLLSEPCQREFVLDIDMDVYNDIRTCCSEKKVCKKCWKFITSACDVLKDALKFDFGFNNIIWFFSGRRGIHAWVCDPRARLMKHDIRAAVVDYLTLIQGSEKSESQVVELKNPLPNHIQRSINTLEKRFEEIIIQDQKLFEKDGQFEKLMQIIKKKVDVNKDMENKFKALFIQNSKQESNKKEPTSFEEKLNELIKKIIPNSSKKNNDSNKSFFIYEEIILTYLYPRIDAAVSKPLNHLLKSPFCIHPSTKKVSLPLLDDDLNEFDPDNTVELDHLISYEFDGIKSSQYISFTNYVDKFNEFVCKAIKKEKKERIDYTQKAKATNGGISFQPQVLYSHQIRIGLYNPNNL